MLNIQIDNPELEKNIKQTYGEDTQLLASAFLDFIQQKRIKQDIGISIKQLDDGESLPLGDVMKAIRTRYE